jgi:hypothetical protein
MASPAAVIGIRMSVNPGTLEAFVRAALSFRRER